MVTNLFLLWVTQVSQGWISPLTWFPPNSVMNNSLTCFSHVLNEFYSKRGKYRSLPMIDFHLCSPFFSYFDFSFILFPFLWVWIIIDEIVVNNLLRGWSLVANEFDSKRGNNLFLWSISIFAHLFFFFSFYLFDFSFILFHSLCIWILINEVVCFNVDECNKMAIFKSMVELEIFAWGEPPFL